MNQLEKRVVKKSVKYVIVYVCVTACLFLPLYICMSLNVGTTGAGGLMSDVALLLAAGGVLMLTYGGWAGLLVAMAAIGNSVEEQAKVNRGHIGDSQVLQAAHDNVNREPKRLLR